MIIKMSALRALTEFVSLHLFALSCIYLTQCGALPSKGNGNSNAQYLASYSSSPFVFPSIEVYEVKREGVITDSLDNYIHKGQDDSSSSTSLQRVNVSRNSDLLFGQVTKTNSGLLLYCNAPYPVQWIFRGDSDPEFNTNTTTQTDTNGKNSYSAYLFLGSRRNLNERETGKYICTSVRNRRLSSFLYVFVTESSLFTNKGLETIYFTSKDTSIRIPCSLSEPRAIATLQKSQDGVLTCPMNDSVKFNAKEGFLLSPSEGTFLCIADYNNTFQIIKYDVKKRDNDLENSSEQTSDEFESPPNDLGQHQPTQTPPPPTQQTTSTPHPVLNPPSSSHPACANKTCGENAYCKVNTKGDAVCRCQDHFMGNPYVGCQHKSEFITTHHPESTTPPPTYPPPTTTTTTSNPGSAHEYPCNTYDDCPNDRACIQHVCQNPCLVNSICGPNTNCETQYHTPYCQCKKGYDGDPYSSQDGRKCERLNIPASHCSPNPCGPKTVCKYVNGIISCSCEPGYSADNNGVCNPVLNKPGSKPDQLTHGSSFSPIPRPLIKNRTHPLAPGQECHYDTDCADDKMCIQDKCENPCVNACGENSTCHIRNHFPRCVCPEGFTGDPFYKCTPLFSGVLGTSVTSVPHPLHPESIESQSQSSTLNCGGDNSPCGPNTICQANRNQFVCVCPNYFTGDPYSSQGCVRKSGYLKCDQDSDCPHFLSCLKNQGCVNPCNVKHVCKDGESCVPHYHRPACLKNDNSGSPYPRDGLTMENDPDESEDVDFQDELENTSTGISNSSGCFLNKNGKLFSACGKNSICYTDSSAVNGTVLESDGIFCGCKQNYIGDPYVACEHFQPCGNSSVCEENEACVDGFCRANFPKNNTSKLLPSNIKSINPCSPSPCTNPKEICTIMRSNNSAKCVSSFTNSTDISTPELQLSTKLLRSGVQIETVDDEEDTGSTTDASGDYTFFPPTATSSSYLSTDTVSSASLEHFRNQSGSSVRRHFVDSSSVETTPTLLKDEEAVVDV